MKQISLSRSLNQAYRKQKPNRKEFDTFLSELKKLFQGINEQESEEYAKNNLSRFLHEIGYKSKYFINTKGRNDLVIHTEKKAQSPVGVIFELKRPRIKTVPEMMTPDNPNRKALHELILYYLRERIEHKNTQLKHLIVSDIYQWFLFNVDEFDKHIYRNTAIRKLYKTYTQEQKDTTFFYENLKQNIIPQLIDKLSYTYFQLQPFYKNLDKHTDSAQRQRINLFKLFSPTHLLKQAFANDSNSLDKSFYAELLYLIGLEEHKIKGKKIIQRVNEANRQPGSLLENTIRQLETEDRLYNFPNLKAYGQNKDEQLFNIAIELSITWINRVLFLKLLEAQLIKYHQNKNDYRFLNPETIADYDELHELFFEVLAKKTPDRYDYIKDKFRNIPYLNSSLFEISQLERQALRINSLKDRFKIPAFPKTVLKDSQGKTTTKPQNALHYLFQFLDAYDFASEGSEEIQEENKTLINASVLGLIFEKINGYKEGSFYTPGFITMYMCKQSIRRAITQKFIPYFKKQHKITLKTYDQLQVAISRTIFSPHQILECNQIVNSITICDPAVGSGHFLVSALNEIIAIKSDLGILADQQGKPLLPWHVSIENDELFVTDKRTDEFFEYKIHNGKASQESQRIQQTLFHEKQLLIENCLFGVDINPNSVKICRLRLWIELLKHAYYLPQSNFTELETLPNIDINIKQGNSLISRFDLKDSLAAAFKKSTYKLKDYKQAVKDYKRTNDKQKKREILNIINTLKASFKDTLDKRFKEKISKARGSRDALEIEIRNLKQFKQKVPKKTKDDLKKAKQRFDSLLAEKEEILNNAIYRDAFEWRFEFPEVLGNKGQFLGFDLIIGNPPYVQLQSMGEDISYLKPKYQTFQRTGDIYTLFYERGIQILKEKGILAFITGSAWLRANYGKPLRTFFATQTNPIQLIDFSDCQIFDSATVLTSFMLCANEQNCFRLQAARITHKQHRELERLEDFLEENTITLEKQPQTAWIIVDKHRFGIKNKIEAQGVKLLEWDIKINYGVKTGYNDAFIIDEKVKSDLIAKSNKAKEILKPLLRGRDIGRYYSPHSQLWLIALFPSKNYDIEQYPILKNFLLQKGKKRLEQSGAKGSRKKTLNQWFETQDSIAYWNDFEKPKIIYPEITKGLNFSLDQSEGLYGNNKIFILTGKHLEYLVAFFNSKLFRYCFTDNFPELQGNSRELRKVIFEQIPVKEITPKEEEPFIEKVSTILSQKQQNPQANTLKLETEIDNLVYKLYNLSKDEIALIEKSIP